MNDLHIEKTTTTPAFTARASDGFVELAGDSYPENSAEYYEPMLGWIREFIQTEKRPLTVHFRMSYFNTSSSKCLLDALDMLESYHYMTGGAVEVTWWYDAEDDDMLESGRELCEGLDLKCTFSSYTD
jgi:SiaC family regulatory phosphoprotein